MRFVVLTVMAVLLGGCMVAPASRGSVKMLTIRPPQDAANANVSPYTVPWPKGSDGALLSGETIVLALVGKDGTVKSIRVASTSGVPALDLAAAESVHRWHFTPATRNGVAIEAYVRVPVMMDPTRSWAGPEPSAPSLTKLPPPRSPWGQLTPSNAPDSTPAISPAAGSAALSPRRIVTNQDDDPIAHYLKAIQATVTAHWVRPPDLTRAPCIVHITQLPGGEVINAEADASCPYNLQERKAAEDAVRQASPLPYKGFESVFQRRLDFTFNA